MKKRAKSAKKKSTKQDARSNRRTVKNKKARNAKRKIPPLPDWVVEKVRQIRTALFNDIGVGKLRTPSIGTFSGRKFLGPTQLGQYLIAAWEMFHSVSNLPRPPGLRDNYSQTKMRSDLLAWCDEVLKELDKLTNDGSPFYKPIYFQQWNIGDELLRRNVTDSKEYTPGKVRRQKQSPGTASKGKYSRYWYSEPDVRRAWPDRVSP